MLLSELDAHYPGTARFKIIRSRVYLAAHLERIQTATDPDTLTTRIERARPDAERVAALIEAAESETDEDARGGPCWIDSDPHDEDSIYMLEHLADGGTLDTAGLSVAEFLASLGALRPAAPVTVQRAFGWITLPAWADTTGRRWAADELLTWASPAVRHAAAAALGQPLPEPRPIGQLPPDLFRRKANTHAPAPVWTFA